MISQPIPRQYVLWLARSVVVAVFLLAAFPVSANAAHAFDHYSQALQAQVGVGFVNTFNFYDDSGVLTPFSPHPDATHAPLGPETLPDGQPEPTACENSSKGGTSAYGTTAWYEFHPDVPGTAVFEVRPGPSAFDGFDAVVTIMQFNPSNGVPNRSTRSCIDFADRNATEQGIFPVAGGQHWKIQLGGYVTPDGTIRHWDYHQYALTFFRDTDGDKVFDSADACPTVPGDKADGCPSPGPRPNGDGDAYFDDGPDKCLNNDSRKRDDDKDGCLDLLRINPTVTFKPGVYCPGGTPCAGLKLVKVVVTDIPKGTKVAVKCTRRACKEKPKKAKKRGRAVIKINRNARAGTKLTVLVTKQGAIGRRVSYTILRNDFAKSSRCLKPGSKKALRCSPKLATRFDGSP